jgi:hypothetical protein
MSLLGNLYTALNTIINETDDPQFVQKGQRPGAGICNPKFSRLCMGWGKETRRMASSGMSHRVALVRTDVSEVRSASNTRVARIGEPGTLAVSWNRRMLRRMLRCLVTANVVPSSPILATLMMEAKRSSETLVFTRAIHLRRRRSS